MKNSKLFLLILFTAVIILGFVSDLTAQREAPAPVAAALAIKLMGFNNKLKGDITVYVVGDQNIAQEMKKGVGKSIGAATLINVEVGDELPKSKPNIIFVCSVAKSQACIDYARKNKIMSVTGIPDLANKGVSLGIGVGDDGKPKILLNLSASAEEGIDWNPAIMKVAQTIK